MGLKFASYVYSTKDAPGLWSLVLFLTGCNLRCKHCINWKLVVGEEESRISEEEVLKELQDNPIVEGLILSGGEPSIYNVEEVIDFLKEVKRIKPELRIRIDTNGSNPDFLMAVREFVDGFAVDVKAPLESKTLYEFTTGRKINTKLVGESLKIADGMPLTIFRTVEYPWLSEKDKERIKSFLSSFLSPHYFIPFVEVKDCPFNREKALAP